MFKKILPYLLLFILALLPRFLALGIIPVSLAHDEVDMIIQAHSLRLTGTDLTGTYSPFSLLPNDAVMAELGPVVNWPALSLLPNTLFSAHFTTALLGSLYPLLVVWLLVSLGFTTKLAFFAGFLLALSPWHILFSRTSLEQPTSLFFYTLSWIFLSKIFSKNNNLKVFLLSTFTFVTFYSLGFYTYHGYKFALPLLTAILALYHGFSQKSYKTLLLVLLVITGLYARIYLHSDRYLSRGSELVFLDAPRFSRQVDEDRRLSLQSDKLDQLFSNKLTAMLSLATHKYLSILSPEQLFLTGEKNGAFSTGRTGYLYLFLFPFVAFGLTKLLRSGPKGILVLTLLALSPLATVMHVNSSFAFRSGIFLVLLTITAAVGVVYLDKLYPKIKLLTLALLATFVSFAHFSYVYFGLYPVESARAYFFADRTLATYLSHRQNQRILVIDPQPRYIMSYLVLTNRTITQTELAPLVGHYSPSEEKNEYQLGNLTLRRDCPQAGDTYDTIIVDSAMVGGLDKCPSLNLLPTPTRVRLIADPVDSGGKKIIYNDSICDDQILQPYLKPRPLATFALDKMSRVQFCTSWLIEN